MLFFYCYWAFNIAEQVITKYSLAILVPAIVVVVWGIWAAPKSKYRLKNPLRSSPKLALLFLAAILCFSSGQHAWAIWYGSLTVLNAVIAYFFSQDY